MLKSVYKKIVDVHYQVLGLIMLTITALDTAMAIDCQPGNQSGIGSVACTVESNVSGVGGLLMGSSFVGGVGFVAAGILKLKEASGQGQAKYSDGFWRLGVGGALIALPTAAYFMKGTLFGTGGQTVQATNGVSW